MKAPAKSVETLASPKDVRLLDDSCDVKLSTLRQKYAALLDEWERLFAVNATLIAQLEQAGLKPDVYARCSKTYAASY